MSSPTIKHWVALEQILCYLNGAPGRGLYIKIKDTQASNASLMQIGQDQRWIGDQLSITMFLWEEI